jgi:hypothetical protein
MKRIHNGLAVSLVGVLMAAAAACFASAGCGSSVSNVADGGGKDANNTTDQKSGGKETGSNKEGGSDALPDIATPEAEASTTGCLPAITAPTEQILDAIKAKLTGFQVLGLTADKSNVIYIGFSAGTDGGSIQTVLAQPVAGGASTTILANLTASASFPYVPVTIDQNTVFVWNNVSAEGVGALSVWNTTTKTTTAVTTATASKSNTGAAAPDSSTIVFTTGVNTAGTTGALVGAASTAPSTTLGTLIASTDVHLTTSATDTAFAPLISYVSPGYVVASHEETGAITISSWTTSATAIGTEVDLVTPAAPFSLNSPEWDADTAGTYVAAITSGGQLMAVPTSGTGPISVGPATGTTQFVTFKDATGILSGSATALSSTTLPGNTTIVPVGISGTGAYGGLWTPFGALGPSPDDTQILYWSGEDTKTDGVSLYLAANAAASTPVAIVSSESGAVFGDVFTSDSKYVIYINELANAGGSVQGSIGQLSVWDVAGSKSINVSTGATDWDSNALGTVSAPSSLVLYNDNFQTGASTAVTGWSDLKTVDVSAGTLAPTLIQAKADMNYYLSTDKSVVIYTLGTAGQCDTDAAGIYAHTF